jgi:hypothetical protein
VEGLAECIDTSPSEAFSYIMDTKMRAVSSVVGVHMLGLQLKTDQHL